MKELSDGRMSQLLLNRRRVNAVGKRCLEERAGREFIGIISNFSNHRYFGVSNASCRMRRAGMRGAGSSYAYVQWSRGRMEEGIQFGVQSNNRVFFFQDKRRGIRSANVRMRECEGRLLFLLHGGRS